MDDPICFFTRSFWRCGSLFSKRFRVSKKEPDRALFSLMIAAAVGVFIILAVKTCFIEGRIIHIEVFLVAGFILSYAQGITNLTKSKRCPKALDT
jgi:hypothetical protein